FTGVSHFRQAGEPYRRGRLHGRLVTSAKEPVPPAVLNVPATVVRQETVAATRFGAVADTPSEATAAHSAGDQRAGHPGSHGSHGPLREESAISSGRSAIGCSGCIGERNLAHAGNPQRLIQFATVRRTRSIRGRRSGPAGPSEGLSYGF